MKASKPVDDMTQAERHDYRDNEFLGIEATPVVVTPSGLQHLLPGVEPAPVVDNDTAQLTLF